MSTYKLAFPLWEVTIEVSQRFRGGWLTFGTVIPEELRGRKRTITTIIEAYFRLVGVLPVSQHLRGLPGKAKACVLALISESLRRLLTNVAFRHFPLQDKVWGDKTRAVGRGACAWLPLQEN